MGVFGCPPLEHFFLKQISQNAHPIPTLFRLADFVQRARQNGQGGTNDQDCSDLGGTKMGGLVWQIGGDFPLMDTYR